jgi:hypothetical protein
MAGRGPAPKTQRRNKADVPIRGEWQPTPGIGWQHGPVPTPPDGLLAATRTAWATWLGSWFASHWTPDNLPDLRTCIRLYDQVERGEFTRATELRMWEDNLGITPKGQQDRRWSPPKVEDVVTPETPAADDPYRGLRAV